MALRFRLGLPTAPRSLKCAHAQCKAQEVLCQHELDEWEDHAVSCNIGAYISSRHESLNHILAQAAREAGYATLMEQVVPEFAVHKVSADGAASIEDARIDVELFGHPTAISRLLDGTVRHHATKSTLA